MKIIDFPTNSSYEDYNVGMDLVVNALKVNKHVVSIFQLGSITDLGISDIDILVVFKDNAQFHENPLSNLNKNQRYLFSHNLFGITLGQLTKYSAFFDFYKFNLLFGEEILIPPPRINVSDKRLIDIQTALEFMTHMYISLSIQKTYRMVKLRSLFLEIKGLKLDFSILGTEKSELSELIQMIIEWRKDWFNIRPDNGELIEWFNLFYSVFDHELDNIFKHYDFYIVKQEKNSISKNIKYFYSPSKKIVHTGLVLPNLILIGEKKQFGLNNRLNNFKIGFPYKTEQIPEILIKRSSVFRKIGEYNSKNLPFFIPLTTSLNIT